MKVEEVLKELEDVFIDRSILWLSIEEAKYWGMNCIYYTLTVEPHFTLGIAAFEIIVSYEELIPIAVLLQIPQQKVKELTLDRIAQVVKRFQGYIYGAGDEYGILIPLNEDALQRVFTEYIPQIGRELIGVEVRPKIDGFYLDYLRPSG
ncbi:MAG TPA: hypothetical protein EYP48_02760 [Ignisphaera sp.]|uniref:Uncharacterized protein n=1 Tax=Ignisphaera aggregans TaxID=334771 RepID=A0A833DVB4_9CREN|nr:hypothetical protein [Ignisphaera sp.]HIP57295.1 hypothetical protein [Ignisphaera aggregans]